MEELTTGATPTTHGPKITLPGHRGRGFELFVQLIFQLAALIGHRVHLGSFGCAAGLQAMLLGAGQQVLLVAHFGLQLAEMLVAYDGLRWDNWRQSAILLVRDICRRHREIGRRRAPTQAHQQQEDCRHHEVCDNEEHKRPRQDKRSSILL